MKLAWKDAWAAIEDNARYLDGEGKKWCEVMWMLVDKHNKKNIVTILLKNLVFIFSS